MKQMTSLTDMFKGEDRVQVKFADFYRMVQQASKYEIVMNGVNCNIPHAYIREMATGENEGAGMPTIPTLQYLYWKQQQEQFQRKNI